LPESLLRPLLKQVCRRE